MERLGSSRISSATTPSTTRNGSTPVLKPRIASPFLAASIAAQTATAKRAASDGWRLSGPRVIQRRAPFNDGLMARVNGSSGTISNTRAPSRSGQAIVRKRW